MIGTRHFLLLAGAALVALNPPAWAQQQGGPPQPAPATTAGAEAAAVPTVPVRAGIHEDYVRLVFDWQQGVDYVVDRSGPLVTLRFSRPGRADLAQAGRAPLRGVTALNQVPDDGGMKVSFVVAPEATLRHFKSGTRVVVDVVRTGGERQAAQPTAAQPPQSAQRQQSSQPTPQARPDRAAQAGGPASSPAAASAQAPSAQAAGPAPASAAGSGSAPSGSTQTSAPVAPGRQLTPAESARRAAEGPPLHEIRRSQVAAQPSPQSPAAPRSGTDIPSATAAPAQSAPAQPAAAQPQSAPAGSASASSPPASSPSASTAPVPLVPPQQAQRPAPAAGPTTAPPAMPAPVAAAQTAAPPVPTAVPAAGQRTVAQGAAPAAPEAATPAPEPTAMSVAFDPGEPTAAAVFERAGFIYVLFDRELSQAVTPQMSVQGGIAGPVERFTHDLGTGFRFAMPLVLEPAVERDGTAWRVVLRRPGEAEAGESLSVLPEPEFALGPRLVVQAPDAGDVISFTDPVVGDVLQVVPLPAPGQRVAAPLRYREAHILPSAQGIVVRPIDDRLLVQAVRDGVEITVPGGMWLSPPEDVAAALPPPPPKEPDSLYDYGHWGLATPGKLIADRQNRWNALGDLPADDKARGRLDLARFYVANGFGPEALGLLDLVLEEQPDLDRRAEFLAVRGAARLLAGDAARAARDLRHRSLDNEPDARIWRAAASAAAGEWQDAYTRFRDVMDMLREYPEPLFGRLGLLAVEAMLRAGDHEAARRLLDRMDRRGVDEGLHAAAFHYFQGEAHRQAGDVAKAKGAWEPLASGRDHYYGTLARRDLIELRLKAGEIDVKAAADQMERLRFAWRGDQLELAINRRIGDLHVAARNYSQGFDTMRRTVSLFPDDPQAAEITQELSDIFKNLFIHDGAAHLPPLEALALYEQYRELTPPGPDGDLMIRRLAERLVEIDLLGRASELLEHQVRFRLAGEERARVGVRLAGIRLLNAQPQEAIDALDRSESPGLPADLTEERRLLRARALSQTDRSADAVQLLATDQSVPANLLRIDIAWRGRKWAAAAQALADVIGPPPPAGQPLPPETAKLVVNRAVALSLAQDGPGLTRLRDEFGPAMERTSEATAFRVLTRPQEAAGLVDAATIQARMAEIDMFRSFLDGYRTRQEAAAPSPSPPAVN